jgi:uncharacterized membrane protein HdeD (DUF308 family)
MTEMVTESEVEKATWAWWLLVAVGVLSAVAGIVILFKPGDSLATLAAIAGIFLLADGVLELLVSLLRSTRNRGTVALFGVISAIAGVILIRHPIGTVEAVALLVGIWLIAAGVIRLAMAGEESGSRGWHALAGALELVAGIVIVANPDIGFATLALLAGIGFIVNGLGMSALGWSMREVEREMP